MELKLTVQLTGRIPNIHICNQLTIERSRRRRRTIEAPRREDNGRSTTPP